MPLQLYSRPYFCKLNVRFGFLFNCSKNVLEFLWKPFMVKNFNIIRNMWSVIPLGQLPAKFPIPCSLIRKLKHIRQNILQTQVSLRTRFCHNLLSEPTRTFRVFFNCLKGRLQQILQQFLTFSISLLNLSGLQLFSLFLLNPPLAPILVTKGLSEVRYWRQIEVGNWRFGLFIGRRIFKTFILKYN